MTPGVVVIPDNPNVIHPVIAPAISNIVKVSGFDLSGIRVSYTPSDDTLSIGLEQPLSQQPNQPGPVIAGDADNNGNDGTVNPLITAMPSFAGFKDFPDFGGSEEMAAFLDLNQTGFADVVAGFAPNDPRSPKEYQVAQAVVNPNGPPNVPPDFGTMLPVFTGNVYKVNSPAHPNLEFAINHFSQLYQQETGKTLTPGSTIGIGAFAGSADDLGISEAFFPEQKFTLSQAIVPSPCPPLSPPVLINPHENHHINTAHPDLIRVSVLGSSGFDVTQIDPTTVTFGGAHPVFTVTRHINGDEFLDETFVFKGTDVHLPPGITEATVSGMLKNGQTFSSSARVFNRDSSFYSAAQIQAQQARWAARGGDRPGLNQLINELASRNLPGGAKVSILGVSSSSTPVSSPQVAASTQSMAAIPSQSMDLTGSGSGLAIKKQDPAPTAQKQGPKVTGQLPNTKIPKLNQSNPGPVIPTGPLSAT